MMRILWFANIPCGATEKLTGKAITGGGWLNALSDGVKNVEGIELHIAFYWGEQIESFEHDGIIYHTILRNGEGSKLGRYINRIKNQFSDAADEIDIQRCINVVKAVNPDIIHVHGSEENFGLIAEHLDYKNIILSIQGILHPIYNKNYAGYSLHDLKKHESFLKKLMLDGFTAADRRFKKSVKREVRIFKHINHVIGRTSWDKACSLILNPNRQYHVVNEILRPEFFNAEWKRNTQSHTFELVTVVSNGLYKGVETVYRTAELLTNIGFKFSWKVIGIDNGDLLDKITESIYKIKSKDVNVVLLGRKNAVEMIAIMQHADLFVQTGHIENSPNSLCEAMLIGMPALATFVGGTSSIIADGPEGTLVQDGDPFAMAGYIVQTANDFEIAVEKAQRARVRAKSRHIMQNVVNELLTVYSSIVNA